MKHVLLAALIVASALSHAQSPRQTPVERGKADLYAASNCAGCHGVEGRGGMGPRLDKLSLSAQEFLTVVRKGKGMMPATREDQLSDEEVHQMYEVFTAQAQADIPSPVEKAKSDLYGSSSCMGCHGSNAMGGLGPPLAANKMDDPAFLEVVRKGKGMMPATPVEDMPDDEVRGIHEELKGMPWIPEQIPIAYKVGQFLAPKNVSKIFLVAFGFFFLVAGFSIVRGFQWAGIRPMMPAIRKMGIGKTVGIFIKSLIVDGFFVASLWKASRHRWFMHALMLYGFLGLLAADILIAVYNPQRLQVPLTHPLKLLPLLSGVAMMLGVSYVMMRYRTDKYIDNGLTLGRDFLFLQLLFHTVVSGFLVVVMKRMMIQDWVMTIYLYHLAAIFLLVVTGPFTRFQHVYMVPLMAALTRVTEAVTVSGADIGFEREPAPGRHHKSQRIAENVLEQLGPDYDGPVRMRYYP